MRILFLCGDLGVPVLGRKGASIHVRELVAALRRSGHDVVLAASALTRSPWEAPAELDVPLVHVPLSAATLEAAAAVSELRDTVGAESGLPAELRRMLHDRDLARELRRRFEHQPPHVVYERASMYSTAGAALADAFDVPLIVELNAPLATEHARYRGAHTGDLAAAAERWLLQRADAVVTVSDALRDHVVSVGVDAGDVRFRPNGVDGDRFAPGPRDPEVRARLGLNGGPTIGFVGGLRPWHGVEALPELLDRLVERHAGVRLVVAGDGPLAGPLDHELRARGLRDRAVLTGALPHNDVPAVIRQLDVALAPYPLLEHEFYFSPLKVVEYLACGVPVVAPRLGQIPELVRDGETGALYPAGDLDGLAAACDGLLADPALSRRLGEAAGAEVRARYTWDANASETVALAHELITSRRAGR
jgi:glycosyltransferase involved in cell wall biosynthesis